LFCQAETWLSILEIAFVQDALCQDAI
jgi:hypothetical protein